LVDENGAVFAAVTGGITLAVAVDVELPHPARAFDGGFPDAGMDRPALPGDVARQADIDGQQMCHACSPGVTSAARRPGEFRIAAPSICIQFGFLAR
jgi:hypothetical protein